MKNIIFGMAMASLLFAACNTTTKTTDKKVSDTTKSTLASSPAKKDATANLISDYLKLKNALAQDNDGQAALAGRSLVVSIGKIDTLSLAAGQAKVFADISADAREHAEHIGSNAGNISHQREHFETLSGEIYDLLKAGNTTGKKLYYANCPMYNKGKGGNWISETKEIHNPYYGKAMQDCGSLKEELN